MRLRYAEIRPLSIEQSLTAILAELDAYGADADADHLRDAAALANHAANLVPRPPRPPYQRRASVQPAATPLGTITTTASRGIR